MHPRTKRATLLALTAAGISGTSVFVQTFTVQIMSNPILFAGVTYLAVAVILLVILMAQGIYTELRTLTIQQWVRMGIVGLIGGAAVVLYLTGLARIPVSTGTLMQSTLFVWVALFSLTYLNESFVRLQWLGLTALFVSNLLLGGFLGFAYSTGVLLVASAILLWAIETTLAKKVLASISSITFACGRMVFVSMVILVFLAYTGSTGDFTTITLAGAGWTVVMSGLLLGYVLTGYTALKHAPASYVAALLAPAALVANVLSAVFVAGTITIPQVASGTLALLGTWFVVMYARHFPTPRTQGDRELEYSPTIR